MPDTTLPDDNAVAAGAVANAAAYLKGVAYPARREDLLQVARDNGADRSALEEIERLPADRSFGNPLEVFDALGAEVRGLGR